MSGGQVQVAQAFARADDPDPMAALARGLGAGPFALVLLFLSPAADLPALATRSVVVFPGTRVVGCTTSGELTPGGYQSGSIVALGFPARHFAAEALVFTGLSRATGAGIAEAMQDARHRLAMDHGHLSAEFALLLVDGLSIREDELVAALSAGAGAGAMPLVGGSAGDGTRFEQTFVLSQGQLHRDAAVVCVLRGNCDLRPFSLDHLEPTEIRMVVTGADPATRTVRRLNDEPAAAEYARLLGRTAECLDVTTFALNPLVVRVGIRHHVRAIQRVTAEGGFVFFSAIDEGVVLSLARPCDLAGHLEQALTALDRPAKPLAILAFDCILRRIEAEETQMAGRVARILSGHRIAGFNTYGEQSGPLHLNQTITGLAFYPPGTLAAEEA